MKRVIVTIIIVAILYFFSGLILVRWSWISQDFYNISTTIIGSIASILGLLAFVSPKISANDLKNAEIEALKKLTKTAEEIKIREDELNLKQNDIVRLELQKKEMEFLVRKASLSLFLKEQYERYNKRIEEIIKDNQELYKLIEDTKNVKEKIKQLDIEINQSEFVEILNEIINSTNTKNDSNNITGLELLGFVLKEAVETLLNIGRIYRK